MNYGIIPFLVISTGGLVVLAFGKMKQLFIAFLILIT